MSDILICTMGYSPGVVTKMAHYLLNEKKQPLSEAWVVRTNKEAIGLLFEDVIKPEFDHEFTGLIPQDEPLTPEDTTTAEEVETFADEFSEFLAGKLTGEGPTVHLCLSGGRKSMTYAATLALVMLVEKLTYTTVKDCLRLWHVQLPSEEEASTEDINRLRQHYKEGRISAVAELRQALLYPSNVFPMRLPILYLGEVDIDRTGKHRWVLPE